MVYFALFVVLSILELASLSLIFIFKDTLHILLSLAAAFAVSALLFLMLDQPLIALVQLFIMLGGIVVYLLVMITSVDITRAVSANYILLELVAVVFFAALYYGISGTAFLNAQGNVLSGQAIASGLSSNMTLLYLIALTLFGIGIGTMVLLR